MATSASRRASSNAANLSLPELLAILLDDHIGQEQAHGEDMEQRRLRYKYWPNDPPADPDEHGPNEVEPPQLTLKQLRARKEWAMETWGDEGICPPMPETAWQAVVQRLISDHGLRSVRKKPLHHNYDIDEPEPGLDLREYTARRNLSARGLREFGDKHSEVLVAKVKALDRPEVVADLLRVVREKFPGVLADSGTPPAQSAPGDSTIQPAPQPPTDVQPVNAPPADPSRKRVIATASGRVKLFGMNEPPEVDGKPQERLTIREYCIVEAMIRETQNGNRISSTRLDVCSGYADSRKSLRDLTKKSREWKKVLTFPNKHGQGYGIR
jgi:hypothetical protein